MDSFETHSDTDSSKTVVLWKNTISPKCSTEVFPENLHQHSGHILYKKPTGISEQFLNLVLKTSEDFVNRVVADSEWAVECYLKTNKSEYANFKNDNGHLVINENVIQSCKNRAKLADDSNHSFFSNPSWLNENGIFDDQIAIENISEYIKQHWNLDSKYLYTVEKSSPRTFDSSCHSYKAEFSVPTNECPIPQVTISAIFTVNVTNLLSFPTVYLTYQLEMEKRVYVVGRHSFNKKHFERLFKSKRDIYMDINKYPGWSSGPSHSVGFNS